MKDYILTKNDYENFNQINLEIRHRISELLPVLTDKEKTAYLKFFKYSENLQKRLYYNSDDNNDLIKKVDRVKVLNW